MSSTLWALHGLDMVLPKRETNRLNRHISGGKLAAKDLTTSGRREPLRMCKDTGLAMALYQETFFGASPVGFPKIPKIIGIGLKKHQPLKNCPKPDDTPQISIYLPSRNAPKTIQLASSRTSETRYNASNIFARRAWCWRQTDRPTSTGYERNKQNHRACIAKVISQTCGVDDFGCGFGLTHRIRQIEPWWWNVIKWSANWFWLILAWRWCTVGQLSYP